MITFDRLIFSYTCCNYYLLHVGKQIFMKAQLSQLCCEDDLHAQERSVFTALKKLISGKISTTRDVMSKAR